MKKKKKKKKPPYPSTFFLGSLVSSSGFAIIAKIP
jgi:hypothetical protein